MKFVDLRMMHCTRWHNVAAALKMGISALEIVALTGTWFRDNLRLIPVSEEEAP